LGTEENFRYRVIENNDGTMTLQVENPETGNAATLTIVKVVPPKVAAIDEPEMIQRLYEELTQAVHLADERNG
jgi:hypothetical protein